MTYRQQLADLPDDILFLVLACLESARDLRALALSCRRLHHIVSNDGWRIFVRNRFPSLSPPAPATGSHTWPQLADSMTWQSRCWDKRSLQFEALLPHVEPRRNGRQHGVTARALFMAVVDAHFDPASQQELVVWGAGEDLIGRCRERQGRGRASKTSWHRLDGKDLSLTVGYDDVTSIKVIEHGGRRAVITGRHNGQVSLLSAEPDSFGERIAQFGPVPAANPNPRQPPEQDLVGSLDILHDGSKRLLAAASRNTLRVYDLAEEAVAEFAPVATYDMRPRVFTVNTARLGGARWMEQGETMALALVGCRDTLRYLSLTPTGWSQHTAAKSERVEREFDIKFDGAIVPNSLEPIHLHSGAKRGRSMLLSSWKDGTIRLQDLRTPSPFDAVFQDNVDPWSNTEALMAYGTDRFIAGSGDGLTLQVYDFRWTRNYYHTTALPCLSQPPFPRPHQPFMQPLTTTTTTATPPSKPRSCCDHVARLSCPWHSHAQSLYYRPNAKYFLSESLRSSRTSSVWSLARSSDVAPSLYVGVSGGVLEASLEPTPPDYPLTTTTTFTTTVVDPHFGCADWRAQAPPDSGYRAKPLVPALMETGDGYSFKGNDRSILLPGLLRYQGPREGGERGGLARHHRLDIGYQQDYDFEFGVGGGGE